MPALGNSSDVKHLPFKHEGPSLVPRTHMNKTDMGAKVMTQHLLLLHKPKFGSQYPYPKVHS